MREFIADDYLLHHEQGVAPYYEESLRSHPPMASETWDMTVKASLTAAHNAPANNQSPDLRDLISHSYSIQAADSLSSVFAYFKRIPHDYVAVLDKERLLGICSRREIGMILGSRFGWELFSKKPVRDHLEPKCLIIRENLPIVEVLSKVFSIEDEYFFNDLVLTDDYGCYLGLISVLTMNRLQHRTLLTLNQELEQHVAELEKTREVAEAANRAKSEFLSNMSHEIRTPMNAVLGLAQLLEKEPLSSDQRDMVQRIRTAGNSLLGILNDILDFSKIEAGQLRIEMRPFMVRPLLTQLDSLMGRTARNKGLALHVATPSEVTDGLVGDNLRLEQILLNLVGNAVKFTAQGEIRIAVQPVALTETTVRLRFEVHDTGVGIAPAVLSNLFKPFTQADDSITRRFGGTGLGLSISKRLVELMGGEIGVESREGVGSTFWFEIPFERTNAIDADLGAAARETVIDGPRLTGRRVLVVDDSEINQIVVARALAQEGAAVELANDGKQALDCLVTRPRDFDIVLMDVQMPVMDGLTATRSLRCEPGLSELPIIAFSAGVLHDERRMALDAGVNDFLPKPVDLEEMVAMLLRWAPPCEVYCARPQIALSALLSVPFDSAQGTTSLAERSRSQQAQFDAANSIAAEVTVPEAAGVVMPETGPCDRGQETPAQLPGLDVAEGIARCGREKLYRELLDLLLQRHGNDDAEIRGALAAGDLQRAARLAHALKGACGTLAAGTVYRVAGDLEAALKHEQRELGDQLLLRLTEAMVELKSTIFYIIVTQPQPNLHT